MNIQPGNIFKSTCEESPLQGLHRVLQILPGEGLVVLIEVPTGPRKKEGAKQKNYYVRGFFTRNLTDIIAWKEQKLICKTTVACPALWKMSDEAIRERYPPKKGLKECYLLSERDRKWKLIGAIIPDEKHTASFELMDLEKKARTRALEVKVSNGQVLNALHSFYAFGCIKNSLIPNTYLCGGPDNPRIAKNGRKLGRRNAAALAGNIELRGKMLTDEDRQNLQDGWAMFVRPGTNVEEAFLAMSSAFYGSGYSSKNGVMVPNLLEAHLRPTRREFRYHGPMAKDGHAAARRLMGEGEWLKNRRELSGSARTGIFSFGQVASIDASPIDVNLVTCFDNLRPIGVGRGIFVTDIRFELILGWHVAIGGIGAEEVNLAILSSSLDKDEILKRYDLNSLPVEDFPAIFCSKYLSDNGELRCMKGMDATVKGLMSRIEFIQSGRADRNSVSESGHHSRHRGLDHHLEGTTKGRQKKRGEPLAITKALLSHYQYMRLLIQWVHWRNTKQEVQHLLTTQMRRDKVQPTRIAIYRWAKEKGYVAGLPVDPDYLKSHLLPSFTASIKRNGLVLHRPNTGNAVELLAKARFSDNYLATSGLIQAAMNGGKKHIEVKANPDDLSHIYLIDMKGVHIIKNVSDDLLLVHEGCISDLGAINDANRQQKVEIASQQDQDKADMRSFRVEAEENAIHEKKAAKSKHQSRPKVKSDRASVRENQAEEKRAQMDATVRRASQTKSHGKTQVEPPRIDVPPRTTENNVAIENSGVIDLPELRRRNLRDFHERRKLP